MADPSPPEPRPSRRSALSWLLGTSLGAVAVAILYPIIRYVLPPPSSAAATNRVLAAKRSELPPNSGKIFRFGASPGIVIDTPTGELRAFTAVCTHLGCTVQYRKDLQQIWCACHGGTYDLEGVPVAGPPPRPLTRYEVAVQGDDVWVSRGA